MPYWTYFYYYSQCVFILINDMHKYLCIFKYLIILDYFISSRILTDINLFWCIYLLIKKPGCLLVFSKAILLDLGDNIIAAESPKAESSP